MSKMFPWCKIKCIQLMITAVLSVFLRTNLQQMHLDFRSLLLVITSLLILNLNKTLANKLWTFYFNRVVTKVAKLVFFQSLMLKWDQRQLLVLQLVPTLMVLLLVRQSVSQVQDKQHQDQQNTVSLARLSGFSGGVGWGNQSANEVSFKVTACLLGWLQLASTSPRVVLFSPRKSFDVGDQTWFVCNMNTPKKFQQP